MLILAGLEPEGRAGLLADVAAVREQGAHPVAVATAVTAQGERTFRVEPVPPAAVAAQVRAALELGAVHAVKVGMICDPRALRQARALVPPGPPWVVDPVVRTSRGQRLSRLRAADYLALAEPDVVITPNALEAAWLLGLRGIEGDPAGAAERLYRHGFRAAVVKGGHLEEPVDFL
ncbi:MAG TPA: bifunctional hydroxymethylpyrimidine kinase/phosphomethylpyrimidine kinase, partial [Myxococcales bacterium]|nr:bifunctional hydroxymethylpyrimidine kinase/phosphomethylpyrimidine kinase [Myxococcales bacterium]